jgi:hypothetical protein
MHGSIELSEPAAERFENWFESVAKPAVAFEWVFEEMLLTLAACRARGEPLLYVLGPYNTLTHQPEYFRVTPAELIMTEWTGGDGGLALHC